MCAHYSVALFSFQFQGRGIDLSKLKLILIIMKSVLSNLNMQKRVYVCGVSFSFSPLYKDQSLHVCAQNDNTKTMD